MNKKRIHVFIILSMLFLTGFAGNCIIAGPVQEPLTLPASNIIDMIQQVNESLLYYYNTNLTAFGPRYTGTENCTKASQYIYDEFHAMGLSVEFQNWTSNKFTDRNVVATLQGSDTSSNAIFIICAHHDTVAISPGADDDGSGVAAVLTIAKILSQYSFNYTIRFLTVSGEETEGTGLFGSKAYALDASRRGDNIVAVVNADQMGYANTTVGERTVLFCGPEQLMWIGDFTTTVSILYRNQTNMTVELSPSLIDNDGTSFTDYGFDAISACSYDFSNPTYHAQNDTSDSLNWMYLKKVTKLLLAVIAEFASTPLVLQAIITKPYQGYFYFFNHPLQPLDFWKSYYHGLRGTPIILGVANLNVVVIPYYNIKYVLFCADGYYQDWEVGAAPYYEWKIQRHYYPLIGRHSIEVYAYDTSGNVASDEINIVSFTLP